MYFMNKDIQMANKHIKYVLNFIKHRKLHIIAIIQKALLLEYLNFLSQKITKINKAMEQPEFLYTAGKNIN